MKNFKDDFVYYNFRGIKYKVYRNGIVIGAGGRPITEYKDVDGYPSFTMGGLHNKRTRIKKHRVMAECFVPNPSNLPEVNHIDFNINNNDPSNLEWCTHRENLEHSIKAGHLGMNSCKGEKNPKAKLKETEVLKIREMLKNGKSISDIRKIFDFVSDSAIKNIKNNKTWKHI